jgi:hypothetical protein
VHHSSQRDKISAIADYRRPGTFVPGLFCVLEAFKTFKEWQVDFFALGIYNVYTKGGADYESSS